MVRRRSFWIILIRCIWIAASWYPMSAANGDTLGVFFVGGSFSTSGGGHGGNTFGPQKEMLDSMGIPWRDVEIESTRPYRQSVPILARTLERSRWDRYLIVSHSLGGVITLDTLLDERGLQDRLAGWIAYQSPFHGSDTTDAATAMLDMVDWFRLRRVLAPNIFGVSEGIAGPERRDYMARNERKIRELTANCPVVCVTSRVLGGRGDTVVQLDSMRLPGAKERHVPGAQHVQLVMSRMGLRSQQQGVFAEALGDIVDRITDCPRALIALAR